MGTRDIDAIAREDREVRNASRRKADVDALREE
jgi:hypothetical protein